jgi:hypothetical protein
VPYLPTGPADLLVPEGTVGEESAELLQEFVRPYHAAEETLVEEELGIPEEDAALIAQAKEHRKNLPWWKRPSGYWQVYLISALELANEQACARFLCLMPLSSIAMSMALAPRIEIYTMLACDAHKPEYTAGRGLENLGIHMPFSAKSSGQVLVAYNSQSVSSSLTTEPVIDLDLAPIHVGADEGPTNGTVLPNPKLCRSDPEVQAAVAKLIASTQPMVLRQLRLNPSAVLATGQGILYILTTAWWGSVRNANCRLFRDNHRSCSFRIGVGVPLSSA